MAARGRSLSGMGYTGYPACIFIERLNYGYGARSHYENKVSLEKWYSALVAYLPTLYQDKRSAEYEETLAPLLAQVSEEVARMHEQYRSTYEDMGTCTQEEKDFLLTMRSVFERLDVITAITKIMDGQTASEELMKV